MKDRILCLSAFCYFDVALYEFGRYDRPRAVARCIVCVN